MRVLYKARDIRLHSFVALNFLPTDVAREPHSLARFKREAQAASALNHTNICTIYEICEQDGHAFIAMSFRRGISGDSPSIAALPNNSRMLLPGRKMVVDSLLLAAPRQPTSC